MSWMPSGRDSPITNGASQLGQTNRSLRSSYRGSSGSRSGHS